MDCGLLRVTRAGVSEPGWPVCVVTRVIVSSTCFRDPEPGLSDSESGHARHCQYRHLFGMASECDLGRGE